MAPQDRPRFVRQLQTGAPSFSRDCGVATALVLLEFASGNAIDPRKRGQVRWWIGRIREIEGKPTGTTTNAQDIKNLFESEEMAKRFRRLGLRPPFFRRFIPGSLADMETQVVDGGRAAAVAVRYATVVRDAPELAGSMTFMENHMVAWLGQRTDDGQKLDLIYDPLCDGRTRGVWTAPRGPQWWPHSLLRQAAADTMNSHPVGLGNVIGGTAVRAPDLPAPEPDPGDLPEPPEPDPNDEDEPDSPADDTGDVEPGYGNDNPTGVDPEAAA